MRKVFLDDMVLYEKGAYKGKINWCENIGKYINFTYEGINGEVQIIGYNKKKQRLSIKYKDFEWFNIFTGDFIRCGLGNIVNNISIKSPWMLDLGVDREEAKKLTYNSSKKIKCICPTCGEIMYKKCYQIYSKRSISCTCGDGFSYPEKFMYSVLIQLRVKFETQLSKTTFEWCNKYKYDFYMPNAKIILETHGIQHYKQGTRGRSLIEEQENDKLKRETALDNGIEHYLELDCRKSELEWIKNSILNSKLNDLFDLSNIDWIKCEEYAIKSNKVKEVCEYWNNNNKLETLNDVSIHFGLCKSTIRKYLKQGVEMNWCTYNPKEEIDKCAFKTGKPNSKSKKVEVLKDGIPLGIFESCSELERQSTRLFGVKLGHSPISAVCLGKLNTYKGYTFQYI